MSGRDLDRDREIVNRLQDPFIRRTLKASLHLRRYAPAYAFAAVWVLLIGLFPTVQDRGGGGGADNSGFELGAGGDVDGFLEPGDAGGDDAGGDVGGGALGGGGARAAGASASPRSVQESLGSAQRASGKTRGGIDCAPGVRQFPSRYATQCTEAFSGDNGGATSAGVSADTIRIVRRGFPDSANSRAVNAVIQQGGGADPALVREIRDVFIAYFDSVYELYGRRIEWVDYESRYGNSTNEALGKGREGACADATFIEKELKAFAVVGGRNSIGVSAVFAECAAQRGLMTFGAAAYYPERWYRQHHPYAWGMVTECERIGYQVGEYIGKRLLNRKAKWAGDPLLQQQTRHFGSYIADRDDTTCSDIATNEARRYGQTRPSERYYYALDVSRFPDQAAQAIVQFKAAGVTTVVLACDPISVIFLTQSAARQAYFPEWVLIGVALTDIDNAARLYDQTAVDGHLFGMSQLGATPKLIGKQSEPAQLYERLTGKPWPGATNATDGGYFGLVNFYNQLQSAGPLLTPHTVGEGTFGMPPGGAPDYPVGYTSYRDGSDGKAGARDHTAIDDSREVYWVGTAVSPTDGQRGTYLETYGGRRFRNGEWPAEEPPVYRR